MKMVMAAMRRPMGYRIRVSSMGAKVRVEERVIKSHPMVGKAVVVDGVAPHRTTRNQLLLKEKQELREVDLGRHEDIH